MQIVHREEMRARILGEVAGRDELAIADEVRERERVVVEHAEKARWAAAMLDVRLALGARGREVDAVLLGEKRRRARA